MEQNVATTAAFKAAEAYEQFLVPSIFRYWTPLLLKRAAPQLGERVLDVACGTGVVARSIVPLVGNGGKVVGLDINPAMLEVACRQFSNNCEKINWREGRAENIPFERNEFALVTCQQGLQFFKNRAKAAEEMLRVLRPNGRVVIEVFQSLENNPAYQVVFNTMASVFNIPLAALAAPFSYGDPSELESLLVDAGFRQVKVESVSQEVHFNEPNRFAELTIRAASAVIPAFAKLDGIMQLDSLSEVTRRIAPFLKDHSSDGILSFPMCANFATAVC